MTELITDPKLTPDDIREYQQRAKETDARSRVGTVALARRVGVSYVTIQKWARGDSTPNEYWTARLVNEFDLPSRFDDRESSATYIYDVKGVTLAFTFIGTDDDVAEAVSTVQTQVGQ